MTTSSTAPPIATDPAGRAPQARPRSRAGRVPGGVRRWRRAASPLALLVLWETASRTGVLPPDKLSAPSDVIAAGRRLAADGTLGDHVLNSLSRAAVGLLIGSVLGLVLAVIAGLTRVGDDLVDPPLQMARMLPHLGLIPLLIIWLGIGESLKISLVAFGAFFPVYLNIYSGIRGIDQRLVEVARTCGLSGLQLVRHVVLPGTLPALFLGIRIAFAAGWLSLVVGEQVNAQSGIGFMMMEAREFSQTDVVVLGLVVYAVLGLLSDLLIRAAERRALGWRRGWVST
jgi:sulfonate transport system permease protein